MPAHNIEIHPIHLGLNATSTVEPKFTGTHDWYRDYGTRHASDGIEGRLVCMSTFDKPWTMWEMHPSGSEVVLCTAGAFTLHQQRAPRPDRQDSGLRPRLCPEGRGNATQGWAL